MTSLIFTCNISEEQASGALWCCRLTCYLLITYRFNSNSDWIMCENETHNFRLVKPNFFLFLHISQCERVSSLSSEVQNWRDTSQARYEANCQQFSSLEIFSHLLLLSQVQGRIISISISWALYSLIYYW